MSDTILHMLPFAIAIDLSPLALVVLILFLFSPRAKSNSVVFLSVWVITLALVVGIARVLTGLIDLQPSSTRETIVAYCKLVLGVVFLLLALRRVLVQRRSTSSTSSASSASSSTQETAMPKWMSGIHAFTPRQALLVTVVVASLGNLPAILAGGLDIGRAKLTVEESIVAVLLFAAIASIAVAGIVVYYLIRQEAATARLQTLKNWLLLHDQAVTTVLMLVLGVLLLFQGIQGLGLLG